MPRQKTLSNSPGGISVVAAKDMSGWQAWKQLRCEKKAEAVAAIKESIGESGLEMFGAAPRAERQKVVTGFMIAGFTIGEIADAVGLVPQTIYKWFNEETHEMERLMRAALTADALFELPRTWGVIKKLRFHSNAETSRKAALDAMRVAGVTVDGPSLATQITINAKNAQINALSVPELDKAIMELARSLGPEAMKLADLEVKDERRGHRDAGIPVGAASVRGGRETPAIPGSPGGTA